MLCARQLLPRRQAGLFIAINVVHTFILYYLIQFLFLLWLWFENRNSNITTSLSRIIQAFSDFRLAIVLSLPKDNSNQRGNRKSEYSLIYLIKRHSPSTHFGVPLNPHKKQILRGGFLDI